MIEPTDTIRKIKANTKECGENIFSNINMYIGYIEDTEPGQL